MNRKLLFFLCGLRDGLPIGLGYLAVSFAFGIQAFKILNSITQSFSISATNLTSAGQFAGLTVFNNVAEGTVTLGAGLVAMLLTQVVINLRYCLMSCALSQKLSAAIPFWQRAIIAFGVTDEIFAVSMAHRGHIHAPYSFGMMAISILGWTTGTTLGAWTGQILPDACVTALGMALYAMFVAIVLPATCEDKKVLYVVLLAAIASALMTYVDVLNIMPDNWRVIFLTVVLSAGAALLFPLPPPTSSAKRTTR